MPALVGGLQMAGGQLVAVRAEGESRMSGCARAVIVKRTGYAHLRDGLAGTSGEDWWGRNLYYGSRLREQRGASRALPRWFTGGRRTGAFTLVELLLVVTIIGVLAALVMPRFFGRSQQARIVAAKQEIVGTLGVALDLFEQDTGRYPSTEEGLRVLISAPAQGTVLGWSGPYIKSASVPLDPWGQEYHYTYPSQLTNVAGLYDLVSAGPDGQLGTDDDVSNHNPEALGHSPSR
ncbi:MAG TPA: type II secretion system major pseudopilin GspG [Phycisphaerae bacterium]|nr:type II secretion system major pseudopilin GspG [Phycisphaerae bacterium]